jgi:hypothetical protein
MTNSRILHGGRTSAVQEDRVGLGTNILLVSELARSDTYLWLRGALSIGETSASSIQDGIDKTLAKIGDRGQIASLYIVGHGNEGLFEIGSDYLTANNAAGLQQFARLRGRFTPKGGVVLDGCKVGHAIELLKKLSVAMGNVKVSASTANQRLTPGMEGGIRECTGNSCTYTGAGWGDTIDWLLGQ